MVIIEVLGGIVQSVSFDREDSTKENEAVILDGDLNGFEGVRTIRFNGRKVAVNAIPMRPTPARVLAAVLKDLARQAQEA